MSLLELIGDILSTPIITQNSRLHQFTDLCTLSWSGFKVRTIRLAAERPVRSLNTDCETLSQTVEIPKILFANNAIVDLIGLAKKSKAGYTLRVGPNKDD
jgi:hypothetical protein